MVLNWIKKAVKRPGSLREWLKRHEGELRRKIGYSVFNKDGSISKRALKRLEKDKELLREIAGSHWRRIWHKVHLADTLKSFKRKRKKSSKSKGKKSKGKKRKRRKRRS